MGIKALLIGISLWEKGLLYWLLCGTVLDKKCFRKKEWIILCVNIVYLGVSGGMNRSMLFFSRLVFIESIVVTSICVILINGQNKLLKIIIIILYNTMVALGDFSVAFASMTMLSHEFRDMVYICGFVNGMFDFYLHKNYHGNLYIPDCQAAV